MKSDVDALKKKMDMIEGLANKLKDASKTLTDKADGAMAAKDKIESQIGGITGKLDGVKKLNSTLGGSLGNVEGLIKKVSGG
jgi:archaellum component FlaC